MMEEQQTARAQPASRGRVIAILSLAIAILSLVGVVYSQNRIDQARGTAMEAQQTAEAAAQLAYEVQQQIEFESQPNVTVEPRSAIGSNRTGLQNATICQETSGTIHWRIETYHIFEMINNGGMSVSVSDMISSGGQDISPHPSINMWTQDRYFGTRDSFIDWLGVNVEIWEAEGYGREGMHFSGPPFVLAPGNMRWFIVHIWLLMVIDQGMTPAQVVEEVAEYELSKDYWFELSDGTEIQVTAQLNDGGWYFNFDWALPQGYAEEQGQPIIEPCSWE